MSCVSTRQMSWLSTRHMSCVSKIRYAQCLEPTQRRRPSAASTKGGGLRPPPFVVSFALALNTGHIVVLRRKTCALLRAKTSASLRRKTCAVLRARTCALFRANTKEATKGGGRRPPPFVEAAEGRLLCVGSEHWAYLIVETQDVCLVESQGICLFETQDMFCVESNDMCFVQSQYKGNHEGGRPKAAPLCGGGLRPPPLCWL